MHAQKILSDQRLHLGSRMGVKVLRIIITNFAPEIKVVVIHYSMQRKSCLIIRTSRFFSLAGGFCSSLS